MMIWRSSKTCLKKFATFAGRASRAEYWGFLVFCVLVVFLFLLVDVIAFNDGASGEKRNQPESEAFIPLTTIFMLFAVIPLVAAGWRRMHDTGRAGIYLLYPIIVGLGLSSLISYVGQDSDFATIAIGLVVLVLAISPLIVFWWLSRPSQPSDNIYGPNPHEVSP